MDLPNELILLLLPNLYESEINALCQTTPRLYTLLNPILYKRSVNRSPGYTLEWAAIHGRASTARLILQAGSAPNIGAREIWQPFALAALHGHACMIELLCKYGIDPCATDTDWKNALDDDVEDWVEGHPLSLAASEGHVSVVELLLEYGVRPDLLTGTYERQTALHVAAENGHLDVTRLLVDAGSDIDAMNGHGATPVSLAAKNGHLHVVRFLLSRGACVNPSTGDTPTPLCMASGYGDVAIVRCLLDHGARVNPSMNPLYQLSWAAEGGHDEIVDLLLQRFDYIHGCTEPSQQAVLLCVAALSGRLDLLRKLLQDHGYGPDLRVSDGRIFMPQETYYVTPKTAMSWAANRGQLDAVKILLAHGASVPPASATDIGPLLRAVKHGHAQIVTTLLDHRADPNTAPPLWPALVPAIPHPRVFQVLLDNSADPTIPHRGQSLLSRVIYAGNVDTLRILLDHGVELIDPVPVGRGVSGPEMVPLLQAAVRGGEGVLRFLMERGFSPQLPLSKSAAREYLLLAVSSGSTALMQLLLDIGCEVHLGDGDGYLLYRAASAEVYAGKIVGFLLQRGCDIDVVGSGGRTALVWAAYEGDNEALEVLLALGANSLVRSGCETPLSMAAREGHLDTVKCLLRSFNARGASLDEVRDHLKLAEEYALDVGQAGILRVLRQYYWRRRYPV